jgi:hypothetical protein
LGIVLNHDQQAREGGALLVGGLNGLFRRSGPREPGARVRDLAEHVALLLRDAFDGLDEVGNEVVPPLELVFHLGPLRFDRLFLTDESVVRTPGDSSSRHHHDRGCNGPTRYQCHLELQ